MDRGFWFFDIETNGFLDDSTVDYLASPWKLKDNFVVHCAVAINYDTKEVVNFVQEDFYSKFLPFVQQRVNKIVAHNGINFDLLVCKAVLGMDYTLGFNDMPETWAGKPVEIVDTYIMSKLLNPDRPGHSIDYLGKCCGIDKIDWRARAVEIGLIPHDAPAGEEFKVYHPEMLVYNKRDVEVNIKVYDYLLKEWGDWPWDEAFKLEQYVAWIVTRQQHRGFWFNRNLAIENVKLLDSMMASHEALVNPHLPPKPLTKAKLQEFIAPVKQFKKDGSLSAHMVKWVEKHNGTINDDKTVTIDGKTYSLPITEPIRTTEPSSIQDTTFIKGILVEMGWRPTVYKERDLTLNAKKKKLNYQQFVETVERYVEQTLNSPFLRDRLEYVKATKSTLKTKLLSHDLSKPLKVYTNPTFTVGQDKEIDPALSELLDKFPYVQQIVEWLTYNHRRNSILGGGYDPDEEGEAEKGFLPSVRSDGRIATPADTCGAASGRFLHRVVVNIPRVTSLFGGPMREMFGIGDSRRYIQFAYDFASLEAMIQSHYVWRYDKTPDKAYCKSLTQEKPNDVHTKTANRISEILGITFSRTNAKNVGYGCSYGAQAAKVAKIVGCDLATGEKIFNAYWEAAAPLADLKAALTKYWQTTGGKKFILGLDGRKINTRSQHSLVNSLFQSGGVICAKRTMVEQDILFRKHNIAVDFWTEDWKNKDYVQQLIAMHDEAQCEMTHGLMTYKRFETEEDRDAWVKEHEEWYPIPSEKGIFAGYSIVSVLAKEGVRKTNEAYKLNVPLSIDPQYGRNWRECH